MWREQAKRLEHLKDRVASFQQNDHESMESLRVEIKNTVSMNETIRAQAADCLAALGKQVSAVNNDKRSVATRLRHRRDVFSKALIDSGCKPPWPPAFAKPLHAPLQQLDEWQGAMPQKQENGPDAGNSGCAQGAASPAADSSAGAAGNTDEDGNKLRLSLPPSGSLFAVAENPTAEFDGSSAAIFREKSEGWLAIDGFRQASSEHWKTKMQAADSKLLADTKWNGLVSKVMGTGCKELKVGDLTLNDLDAEGHEAWVSMRKNAMRVGPQASPMNGLACFVQALTQPVFALLIPLEDLLATGIAAVNYPDYFATNGGAQFIMSKCNMVRLNPFDVLYVPMGVVVHYTYVSTKAGGAGWCHNLHLPVFDLTLAEKVQKNVMHAVNTFSEAYLVSESSTKSIFVSRRDVAKVFFENVFKD